MNKKEFEKEHPEFFPKSIQPLPLENAKEKQKTVNNYREELKRNEIDASQIKGGPIGYGNHNHYFKDVSKYDSIDVYRTLEIFNITHPAQQHLAKKALCAGGRGHKDLLRDIQDIIDTAERWKQMINEDENK
jgi:hypothetical protein